MKAAQAEVTKLKEQIQARVKADADAAVKAAVARGAIAPKNEAIQAKWRETIEKDPSAIAMLEALPGNPALKPVTAASATASAGAGAIQTGGAEGEHEFVTASRAKAAEEKISFAAASAKVAGENPALYRSYAESLAPQAR